MPLIKVFLIQGSTELTVRICINFAMTSIKIPRVDINQMACFCHTSKNGGRHSRNGPLIEPDLGKIEEKQSSTTHAMEFPQSETQNLNFGYPDPSLAQTPKYISQMTPTHQPEDVRGRQRTPEDARGLQRTSEDTNRPAKGYQGRPKGQKDKLKTKLEFQRSKALLRRRQRLQSLIRALKKWKQAGVQNQQLNEKIENFTKECCDISLRLNHGSQEVVPFNEDKNKILSRSREDHSSISKMNVEKSNIHKPKVDFQESKTLKLKNYKPKSHWRQRNQMDLEDQFNNWNHQWCNTRTYCTKKMEIPKSSKSVDEVQLCNVHMKTIPIENLHYQTRGHGKKAKEQQQARGPNNTCVSCGQNPHKYQLNCPGLRGMTPNQIYKIMKKFGIECQMCLGLGHRTRVCPATQEGALKKCTVKEENVTCGEDLF